MSHLLTDLSSNSKLCDRCNSTLILVHSCNLYIQPTITIEMDKDNGKKTTPIKIMIGSGSSNHISLPSTIKFLGCAAQINNSIE